VKLLRVQHLQTLWEPRETTWKTGREADPTRPQVLLFSATMPYEIETAIRKYCRADKLTRVDTFGQNKSRTSETVTHMSLKCPWCVTQWALSRQRNAV
jgi:superfamily II DNA/RNA helicase